MRPGGGTNNGAVGQRARLWLTEPDHAVTRPAQGRIHSKNDLMPGASSGAMRLNRGGGARPGAAHAVLHLLKLLKGDAHRASVPAPTTLQKQKTKARRIQSTVAPRVV